MKEIVFDHMIWNAHSLLNADNLHLCVVVQKGRNPDHPSDSYFWAIYNTNKPDKKNIQWFMDFDRAKKVFLKICEELLKESQETKEDFPW